MTQREAMSQLTKPTQAVEKQDDGSWDVVETHTTNPHTHVGVTSYYVIGINGWR